MTSVEVTRSVGRGELAQLLEAHDTWGWADYRDRDNPRHSWSCECGWKSTPTPYGGGTVDTLPAREHTAAAILAALPGLTTTEPGEGFDDGGLSDLIRIANLEAEVKHLREYGDKQDQLIHDLRTRAEEAEVAEKMARARNALNAYDWEQAEAAFRRLEAVRALHQPVEGIHLHEVCAHRHCIDDAGDQVEWPCPTIQAIDGGDET